MAASTSSSSSSSDSSRREHRRRRLHRREKDDALKIRKKSRSHTKRRRRHSDSSSSSSIDYSRSFKKPWNIHFVNFYVFFYQSVMYGALLFLRFSLRFLFFFVLRIDDPFGFWENLWKKKKEKEKENWIRIFNVGFFYYS